MIITVASYKGGVGKTTTAVHLAAYFEYLNPPNELPRTLLLDGDQTKNATAWEERGRQLPARRFHFPVAPIDQAAKLARNYEHVVIDTGQRPSDADLKAVVDGCDLLVIPAVPAALDTDGLGQMLRMLDAIGAKNFRVLLTRVPPDATHEVKELRALLAAVGAPCFATEIPRLKAYEKAAAAGCIVGPGIDRQGERAWQAYAAAGKEIA